MEDFNIVRAVSTGADPSSLPEMVDDESSEDDYEDEENGSFHSDSDGEEVDPRDWCDEGELFISGRRLFN